MTENPLASLALIVVLGVIAQWTAWRFKLPSILLLLLFGITVGPITGIINTDELLGDLLFPFVSLSVSIILFEGGLSLRWQDVRHTRAVVRNLITIGVLITWIISAAAAYFILDFDVAISLLMGATIVVTGPTVIIPLLKQIRPVPRVSSILRWEGIIIDPVGAVLAVLVFEQILVGEIVPGISAAIISLIKTLLIGGVIGIGSGRLLIILFGRYWVPDTLQNPMTLAVVTGAFALSNTLQTESGLLTVTVMGIVMANQNRVDLRHIREFKETLQVLLISVLFIILAGRIQPEELKALGFAPLLFVAVIIFIERPLAVWISAVGSPLTWREKLFIAWMAPRGIVAASVASIFSLELAEHGYTGAEKLVPVTFSVIILTVAIYGLTAGFVARHLGLTQENPQGLLIVGAHAWARKIALVIQAAGYRVLLVDTNPTNVRRATTAGLEAVEADTISLVETDNVDFSGIGRLLAMTPNDAVNALTNLHFQDIFDEVYQLPHRENNGYGQSTGLSDQVGGNYLFGTEVTFDNLLIRFNQGAEVKAIRLTEASRFQGNDAIVPMFVITGSGELDIWTANNPPELQDGQTVIAMIAPDALAAFTDQQIIPVERLRPVVEAASS